VLAIDIRRSEASEPALKSLPPYELGVGGGMGSSRLSRSKSHPRLSTAGLFPTNVVAFSPQSPSAGGQQPVVPKRLRLVHFWTRTRIFQRAFMICMVVWIGVIAYNAQLVHKLAEVKHHASSPRPPSPVAARLPLKLSPSNHDALDGTFFLFFKIISTVIHKNLVSSKKNELKIVVKHFNYLYSYEVRGRANYK